MRKFLINRHFIILSSIFLFCAFILVYYYLPKNNSQQVVIEHIDMGNGSLGVQREQTLILHKPNRLHFNILQNSRSNDSLINNLQNLAKELHARNDSTTLIEISFDPKVAYSDFIAVIDNFQINITQSRILSARCIQEVFWIASLIFKH